MNHTKPKSRLARLCRSVLRSIGCNRGSSDLTVGLLMTAAGAAMVGLTVPSLFKSSDTAARTFDRQVKILERGAGGGAAGGAAGLTSLPGEGASRSFDLGGSGPKGASASPLGIQSGAPKDLGGTGEAIVTPSAPLVNGK